MRPMISLAILALAAAGKLSTRRFTSYSSLIIETMACRSSRSSFRRQSTSHCFSTRIETRYAVLLMRLPCKLSPKFWGRRTKYVGRQKGKE